MRSLPPVPTAVTAHKIREARTAASLTQAELADKIGAHRNTIVNVETGRHAPSLGTLAAIAVALGVQVGDLMEQPDPPLAGETGAGPTPEG